MDDSSALRLLRQWLLRSLQADDARWVQAQLDALATDRSDRKVDLAFGLLPRRVGRRRLELSASDLAAARDAAPDWAPHEWTTADAARVLVLCEGIDADRFPGRFRALCATAEVAEAVSLYRGLCLYPDPARLEPQVGEGLRTNVRAIFDAIAHDNPYPRRYFDAHRFDHMVLKALFIGSPLAPIQGLDERADEELARMLVDFAHERWAAGRPVPYEIWRCVGRFARGAVIDDLVRVLRSDSPIEQRAAALALHASPDPGAARLLDRVPAIAAEIAGGSLRWNTLH